MEIHPNRINQIKWGLILMTIGLVGLSFHFFAKENYETYSNVAIYSVGVSIGAILLSLLALISKIKMKIEESLFSKNFYIFGIKVIEISFRPEKIADVKLIDGCDIHFTLEDGRMYGFDNLREKDAMEIMEFLKPLIDNQSLLDNA